jgi:hemolysin activation/secretion protein
MLAALLILALQDPSISVTNDNDEKSKKQQDDFKTKVKVERFKFTGYTVLSLGTLQSIVAPYEGKELTMAQIKDICLLISREYREQGYLLAWAYVPPQEVRDGVVEIAIVEGKVDRIVVGGNKHYSRDFVSKHLGPLEGQPILSMDSLERALLILNDYPKMHAEATLKPGRDPGTTDIHIQVEDEYPIQYGFDYDNFGTESVSEHRMGFSVDFLNLWYMGHEVSIRAVVGAEVENLQYGRIEYRMPVGANGFRINAMIGYMNYQATGGLFDVIEPNGEGPIYSLSASYPILKSRETVVTIEAGFSGRDIQQRVNDFRQSYDHIRSIFAGASLDLSDHLAGRTVLSAQMRYGLGEFMGGTMEDDEPSRPGASNEFSKFYASVMRIQRIVSGLFVIVKGTGQLTSDPLLASEQFGLGGAESVRGFPSYDYAGDWGYTASIELRLVPPGIKDLDDPFRKGKYTIGDVLQFVAFFDHGQASLEEPGAGERDLVVYQGAGGGIRITYPNVSIRFDIGFPVGKQEPTTGDDVIYYIQIIASY